MRTIAVINQKGGTGKTTTAINLACVFASRSERTLLVDTDPQGHCGLGLAVPPAEMECQLGDAMLGWPEAMPARDRLLWSVMRGLDLIPASARLAALQAAQGGLADRPDREQVLAGVLDGFAPDYDWCVIDCSPSIGLLTYNAIVAAGEILIPVETGFFALQGAMSQVAMIESLTHRLGRPLPHRVLATMHDPTSSVSCDVVRELTRQFGSAVIPVEIRQDHAVREAASLGVGLVEYAPSSSAAEDYATLATWLTLHRPPAVRRLHPDALAVSRIEVSQPSGSEAGLNGHLPAGIGPSADDGASSAVGMASAVAPPPSAVETKSPRVSRAAELADRARFLNTEAEVSPQHVGGGAPRVRSAGAQREAGLGDPETEPPDAGRSSMIGSPGVHVRPGCVVFAYSGKPGQLVSVAGEFNGWSADADPLGYEPGARLFTRAVDLPGGDVRYRYVVDGQWLADPANPRREPNEFGEMNSVVSVPGGPEAGGTRSA